jgi:hypothetical protein
VFCALFRECFVQVKPKSVAYTPSRQSRRQRELFCVNSLRGFLSLKKLVLEAEATGFQDHWKGSWELLGQSGHEAENGRVRWETNGRIL